MLQEKNIEKKIAQDLIIIIDQPDLILTIFNQIPNTLETNKRIEFVFLIIKEFTELLNSELISKLVQSSNGNILLNNIQKYFGNDVPQESFGRKYSQEQKQLSQILFSKIENIRIVNDLNDNRPSILEMVENNLGMQFYRQNYELAKNQGLPWIMDQGNYRFGIGHDGEHVLGSKTGSRVKTTLGISGRILGYYSQRDETWAVILWLEPKPFVLVLKDLVNLSKLVLKSPQIVNNNGNAIPIFDKNKNPISNIKIGINETIGFTRAWTKEDDKKSAIGLHVTVVKYEYIQQFRQYLINKHDPIKWRSGQLDVEVLSNYAITPCGNESPIKCR